MKYFIPMILMIFALPALAQETKDLKQAEQEKETDKVPKVGQKVLPERQEEDPNLNPFKVGPYYKGRYIFTPPQEDTEENK